MMGRRYTKRRRHSVGAWIYPALLVFISLGVFAQCDTTVRDTDPGRCDPLVWSQGMDTEGWRLLNDQGYRDSPTDGISALYPPGCEREAP